MSEITQLITTLKRELKCQGKTYRDVGTALGLSEPSVKRLFATGQFTLERLVEICSLLGLTLAELAQAQAQWKDLPDSTRPRVLFVSVDPERDTPTRIGEYAHAFHPDTLAATADIPALENFAKSLGFVFMKVPGKGYDQNPNDYSMDHSSAIAVLDPQGQLAGLIRPPFQPQAIAADMRALTGASSK